MVRRATGTHATAVANERFVVFAILDRCGRRDAVDTLLAKGVNRVVMRPDGPLRRELADVRSLRLTTGDVRFFTIPIKREDASSVTRFPGVGSHSRGSREESLTMLPTSSLPTVFIGSSMAVIVTLENRGASSPDRQIGGRPEQGPVQTFAPNDANQPFNDRMGERQRTAAS